MRRLERSFYPSTIQKLMAESDKDFDIGGPHLAAEAIKSVLSTSITNSLFPN